MKSSTSINGKTRNELITASIVLVGSLLSLVLYGITRQRWSFLFTPLGFILSYFSYIFFKDKEEEIKKNYPKRTKSYIAIEENKVVGTISIDKLRGDSTGTKYIILTVFVKTENHHQGIGTMLIKKIENYLKI